MTFYKFLEKHPVFRFKEALAFEEQNSACSGPAVSRVKTGLYYHTQKGEIVNVRRGLYARVRDRGEGQELMSPLLMAGKATDDAVLAYHTALELHGIAYTDFNEQMFLTKCKTSGFSFQGQYYRPVIRGNLISDTGIQEVIVSGLPVLVTSLERTVVDVLDMPNLSGGWEEVFRSLERVIHFDVSAAVDYVIRLGKKSAVAKLGYFIDSMLDGVKKDASAIRELKQYLPKQPHYMDKFGVGGGVLVGRWNLIVPKYIDERRWEDPDETSNEA